MDSALLKTEHKGQLITLCIRDDDNLLLRVAVAIVEKESEESYTYFFQNCMKNADFAATFNSKDMTIFTDGQKGPPPSSREVLLQRRGVQVPTALHQERPRDRLGER